jgi:hypothetical protein
MSESLPHNASRIKKALVEAGFEVFRTRNEEIVLAERPRENLIMDSGVRLRLAAELEVRVVLRAQKADFPNEEEARIFERVRKLADRVVAAGFSEVSTSITKVTDPGDAERTLDTFYEITYAKAASALSDALAELKFAMALEKRAE